MNGDQSFDPRDKAYACSNCRSELARDGVSVEINVADTPSRASPLPQRPVFTLDFSPGAFHDSAAPRRDHRR
ncbi:hypothetical protein C1890_05675 [Pseudomonas sp. DP16D-R1]|nr:hypothetical protein C1890_05675 [Pseudomonas sp. DP16D-R1]